MIFIVFGLPGSGKSYFASHLVEMTGAQYINSDRVRKNMYEKRTYSALEKQMVYDEMRRQMQESINQNKDVVLDATFYKNDLRKKFIGTDNTETFPIEVQSSEDLIKKRLLKFREESEADFEVYKEIKKEWEPMIEEHLILQSTDDNIQDMLEQTVDYLYLKYEQRTN